MLVWVIFVSVVWMYVSYTLPEAAYLEYIYAELLKMWLLTHFMQLIFYTFGFLMFSGGIERDQRHEMG